MSRSRRFISIILTAALSISAGLLPAAADFEDEQWPSPDDPNAGSHIVSIQDGLRGQLTYSQLTAYKGDDTFLCKSVDDAKCKGANFFQFVALLPACQSASELDCIEGITASNLEGKKSEGSFDRYTYYKHPNIFSGKVGQTIQNPSSPSVWKISDAPHAYGNEYGVAVSVSGGFGSDGYSRTLLNMNLYAVSEVEGPGEIYDQNGFSNIGQCNQAQDAASGRYILQCGEGARDLGQVRCALKVQKTGGCLLQRAFPVDHQFKISLRLTKEPTGWFHGRMKNPTVQVEKLTGSSVRLSVMAAPTRVPIFYQSATYKDMPEELKAHWDKCLSKRTCPSGTRLFGKDPSQEPDGNLRNAIHDPPAFGSIALDTINFFAKYAGDKSVAAPLLWSARSLPAAEMNGADKCFNDGSGVKGILTTNATAYAEGPPKFSNGTLNYRVAGLHYAADGKTLNEGVYDMVMKSSVARCLYGFSSAPISATIAVTSADGEKKVATTVVSEKNGWLKLAAYGFTFSSPTISVKLSQGKSNVKKTTITCVSVKNKNLVKRVTAVSPKCSTGFREK